MQRQEELVRVIENPVDLMERALSKNSQSQQISTMEMYQDAKIYADREMTEADYFMLKEKYVGKQFLNLFFEGSQSLMELT